MNEQWSRFESILPASLPDEVRSKLLSDPTIEVKLDAAVVWVRGKHVVDVLSGRQLKKKKGNYRVMLFTKYLLLFKKSRMESIFALGTSKIAVNDSAEPDRPYFSIVHIKTGARVTFHCSDVTAKNAMLDLVTECNMTAGIHLPPSASSAAVPVLSTAVPVKSGSFSSIVKPSSGSPTSSLSTLSLSLSSSLSSSSFSSLSRQASFDCTDMGTAPLPPGLDACSDGGQVKMSAVQECAVIPPGDVVKQERIGVGAEGQIFAGSWRGERVALKFNTNIADASSFLNELAFLQRAEHAHIVRLHGAYTPDRVADYLDWYMVLERCDTDLSKLLAADPFAFTAVLPTMRFLLRLADAGEYLHRDLQTVHGDLKGSNVLVKWDDQRHELTPHLCDFGTVSRLPDTIATRHASFVGTETYMAPELHVRSGYTEKADIYSFAMIVYELLTKRAPFSDRDPAAQRLWDHITAGGRPSLPPDSQRGDFAPLYQLMTRCWHHNPNSRPSFTTVRQELLRLIPDLNSLPVSIRLNSTSSQPISSQSISSQSTSSQSTSSQSTSSQSTSSQSTSSQSTSSQSTSSQSTSDSLKTLRSEDFRNVAELKTALVEHVRKLGHASADYQLFQECAAVSLPVADHLSVGQLAPLVQSGRLKLVFAPARLAVDADAALRRAKLLPTMKSPKSARHTDTDDAADRPLPPRQPRAARSTSLDKGVAAQLVPLTLFAGGGEPQTFLLPPAMFDDILEQIEPYRMLVQ